MAEVGLFYCSTTGEASDIAGNALVILGKQSMVTVVKASDIEPSESFHYERGSATLPICLSG